MFVLDKRRHVPNAIAPRTRLITPNTFFDVAESFDRWLDPINPTPYRSR